MAQTQTWCLEGIRIRLCLFVGWGWNSDTRQMTKGETSVFPELFLLSITSFLLSLARILLIFFSWEGGGRGTVKTSRRSQMHKSHKVLLIRGWIVEIWISNRYCESSCLNRRFEYLMHKKYWESVNRYENLGYLWWIAFHFNFFFLRAGLPTGCCIRVLEKKSLGPLHCSMYSPNHNGPDDLLVPVACSVLTGEIVNREWTLR